MATVMTSAMIPMPTRTATTAPVRVTATSTTPTTTRRTVVTTVMAMVTATIRATTRRMASGIQTILAMSLPHRVSGTHGGEKESANVSSDAANTKSEKENKTESNKPKSSKEAMSNTTNKSTVKEENELCDKVAKDDLMATGVNTKLLMLKCSVSDSRSKSYSVLH
ncbi:hypothetical protein PC110_g14674 [Phytophthora cactorum]|uniref:Uncharacterized protein n=2 Tax=Phytophthora cactorum TaxID=29920 RepID=A0A329RW11_9STRA|nr:hypothetical protein PC119_g15926 [Phytophthora cactorum]KAG3073248.1 hypothetical protein PC122_g14871 [Phytophthora cactorum]RAW28963.1 hypothetical protein PC110_g14674 [Phytophthora cactorum]